MWRSGKIGSNTKPHPIVVGRELDRLFKEQLNRSESTRYDYGNLVVADGSSTDNVRTASTYYMIGSHVYNPELGETLRIPLNVFWVAVNDVATVSDRLELINRTRKTLDKFKDEVVAWRTKLAANHIASLTRRLEYLFEDEPELSPKQAAPSLDSFSVLLAYLARHPEIRTPSIGYIRDGTFSAVWVGDAKLRVTLDFMSPTSIRWIFVDSRNGIKESITGAGIVSLDILSGVLDVYGVTDWMRA